MTDYPDVPESWLGLCPKFPVTQASAAVLIGQPDVIPASPPDGSGSPGSSGRIRHGITIGTGSLMAIIRNRQLLWFTFLSGLVMLLLIAAQAWRITHIENRISFVIPIPFDNSFWVNPFLVFDMQLLLLEMVCLSFFTLVLAGLVLHRNGNKGKKPASIRESITGINGHAGSLLALSLALAVIATIVYMITSQSQFIGKIVHAITMTLFWLPYAYYVPNELFSTLYFASEIMFINAILLLVALYVVPGIVLEKKGLIPALAGAATSIRETWREMLGCLLVLGAIFLGVAAIALLIGQSPLLLNRDYDFFLSRGQLLMTIVCYGFIIACWLLMAVGATAAGVALSDLYTSVMTVRVPSVTEEKTEEPVQA
jgi:hypothetical protein